MQGCPECPGQTCTGHTSLAMSLHYALRRERLLWWSWNSGSFRCQALCSAPWPASEKELEPGFSGDELQPARIRAECPIKPGRQSVSWAAGVHPGSQVPFLAECSSFSPPTTVILLILLCFEALLFLIFTSVMFGTQVHSICTDETVSSSPACHPHAHSPAWSTAGAQEPVCAGPRSLMGGGTWLFLMHTALSSRVGTAEHPRTHLGAATC